MFWSAAALLFLESPSERGKERGSITGIAQPGRVGSSVSFLTSGRKASVGWLQCAGCLWGALLRLLCAGL